MSIGILIGALNLVCTSAAQTPSEAHVKFLEAIRTPIKQQKIADCNFQSSAPVSFGTGTMVTDPGGDVTLSGFDRKGKIWTATYYTNPGPGCELWQGYLGNNGEVDLIFVQNGINSSGGWDMILSLLLFDNQGRPFPWQARAKFTVSDSGVQELVELGEEKKIVAIVPERKDLDRTNEQYSYHAYAFSGVRATELVGTYGGVTWPFYNYAAPQNRTNSAAIQTLTTSEKSANNDEIPPTALLFQGAIGTTSSERQFVLSNESFHLPDVLVLDSAAGRRIVTSPMSSDLADLQANRAKGIVLGNSCTDRACHPLVMWLKQ